jgi:hypothetical protein
MGAQLGAGPVPQAHVLDGGRRGPGHPARRHVLEQREVLHELRDREARVVAEVPARAVNLLPAPDLAVRAESYGH